MVQLNWATRHGLAVIGGVESREQYDRYGREVVEPLVAEVLAGRPHPPEVVVPFEVRGLVVPAGVAAR